MIATLMMAAALAVPGEAELKGRLPEIFAKSAEHYKALDAAATPLMKDGKGNLRTPHGWLGWRGVRGLDMQSIHGWTSGHYPGSLWYLYEATGDAFFKERATVWTEILAPNAKRDNTHDLGFMMYCSYGNARRILKTDRYDAILAETAASLSRRFNEPLGLLRSWGAKDDAKDFLVIPDNMMNLELLEAVSKFSGDPRFDRIARSHATVTMKHHFRADGGTYHVLNYDQRPGFRGALKEISRGQGRGCETAWSRGQSWAIYGYTMMYRFTRDPAYLDFAQKVSDYAINHPNMPADGVPYWDYGAPGEERDSSAAAIMASALLELSQLICEAESNNQTIKQSNNSRAASYRAFAVKQLLSLASPAYFSEGDEIGHFLLKHGVGHKPGGGEIDTPLDYGDYYFLEALLRVRGTAVASALAVDAACPVTPENSSLFEKFRDPVSGVESYVLKPGLLGHNQQSLYFTAKSMTDDGRFLVVDVSDKEDPKNNRPPAGYVFNTRHRRKGVVDFEKDRAFILEGVSGHVPHLDRVNDCLYWVDYEAVHRRDLKGDPQTDVIVCRVPAELRSKYLDSEQRIATHLTISRDLTKAFLDIRNDEGLSTPGTLDFRTGKFTPWAHFRFYCNHGQLSPVSDHVALCAREFSNLKTFDELTDAERKTARCVVPVMMPNVSTVPRPAGFGGIGCPRIRLLRDDGTNRIIDSRGGCHEAFTADGNGVFYCSGADGVVLHDLRTDKPEVILPIGKIPQVDKVRVVPNHADLSPDGRFVVYDAIAVVGPWRGCAFRVGLYDRQLKKHHWLCPFPISYIPREDGGSFLHPDPHPQFVCNGRYIVYTMSSEPWRMDVRVTPVAQFLSPQEAPASGR